MSHAVSVKAQHVHRLHRFNCLESSGDDFPRVLYVCFDCHTVFDKKVIYEEVDLKL